MINSSRSKLVSLLAFIMVFAMMICAMSISVFADDVAHDHDGDGVADHTDAEHSDTDDEEKTLGEKISAWFKSDLGQIIGWCVAGVVFVAIVIFIIIWIPKDKKKADKKAEKKIKAAKSESSK